MKKILLIIVLLVVLGGAGAWFYFHAQKSLLMEDVLAADPLLYVKFSDVENNIGKFSQSNFWKKLSQINYDLLISKTISNPSQKNSIGLIKSQLSDPKLWNVLNRFFGREFAMAVYPSSINLTSSDPNLIAELSSSFVLVTKIEADVQVAEFISRSFKDLGSGISTETIKYKNRDIHLVDVSNTGLKVGIVRLGNILVAGIGDKKVKEAIDLAQHQRPALTNDSNFKKVQAQFIPSAGITGYWNVESSFKNLREQLTAMAQANSSSRQQMDEFFKKISGFKILSFSSVQSNLLTMKWNLFTSFQEMDPHVAKFYTSCSPKENKSLAFVPKDAIGYGWGTCVNLANYWDEFKSEVQKIDDQVGKPKGMKNIEHFEQTTGLNVENDIIAAFGNEMGGYLTEVDIPQAMESFPMPKLLFFVEYGDKTKMDALLDKLKSNPLFNLQEEDYKGSLIKYVSMPVSSPIEPGYCYLDKYLLLAFDKTLLKKSIDAAKDPGQSLASTDDFKKLGGEMLAPSTSIQFAKVDQFVSILEDLVNWTESWTSQEKEKRQAFKVGTKRRLSDVAYQIETNRESLFKMKTDVEAIKTQITNEQSTGADVTAHQKELADLEIKITATEKDIQGEEEQKKDLEVLIQQYEKDEATDIEEKQFFVKKAVVPVLEAFKSLKLIGGFSTLENQILSNTLKMEIE